MSEFIDVGYAVMRHIVGKEFNEELTDKDYEAVKERLLTDYLQRDKHGNIATESVLFRAFQNAKYFGNKNKIGFEDRFQDCEKMLDQWKNDEVYITRQHHPYLSRQDSTSYYGAGQDSLPVSGKDFLASQAFVLGCWWLSWGLLAIWSDNQEVMYDLTRLAFKENKVKLLHLRDFTSEQIKQQFYKGKEQPSPTKIIADAIVELDYKNTQSHIGGLRVFVIASGGSSTKITTYDVPNPIFNFLRKIKFKSVNRTNWREIVDENRTKNGSLVFDYLFDKEKNKWIIPYCFIKKDKAIVTRDVLKLFTQEVMNMHDRDIEVLDDIAGKLINISKEGKSREFYDELDHKVKGRQLWEFVRAIGGKRNLALSPRFSFMVRNPNLDIYTARQYLLALLLVNLQHEPWFYEFTAKDRQLSTSYIGE